jgi:competence protein ComEA
MDKTWPDVFGKMSRLDKGLAIVVVLGLTVAGVSLGRSLRDDRVQIEYLESETQEAIYIDIEGAVMTPGVYTLAIGARLKDLLVASGGYSERADREYSQKNLNLAEPLKDGQKVYIPELPNTPSVPGYAEAKSGQKMVNVNTATATELDTLWGVGPSKAEKVIQNRPYGTLDELVAKGGLTRQILEKNQGVIGLY